MPPQDQPSGSELTVVATTSGMMRAQILKSKLEDAGIGALLDYESAGIIFGITVAGLPLSKVRVLVAVDDADLARQILSTPPPPGWEELATNSSPET